MDKLEEHQKNAAEELKRLSKDPPKKSKENKKRITTMGELSTEEVPPESWFLEGIIPLDSLVILGGAGGVGKSSFCYQLLQTYACGEKEFLGLKLHNKTGKSFHGCFEEPRSKMIRKAHTISKEYGLPKEVLDNWAIVFFEPAETVKKMKEYYALSGGFDFAVIDSLRSIGQGANGNNSNEMEKVINPLVQFCSEFEVTCILIHHIKKDIANRAPHVSNFRG